MTSFARYFDHPLPLPNPTCPYLPFMGAWENNKTLATDGDGLSDCGLAASEAD
jgi:hypothetical protein